MSSTSKTPPRCSTMWEELNKIKIEGKSKLITFSVRVEKGKYLQKRKERNEKMLKTSSASEWVREACERERESFPTSKIIVCLSSWRPAHKKNVDAARATNFHLARGNFHAMIFFAFLIFIFFHFMFSCFFSVGQKSFAAWFVCVSRFYQKKNK